MSSFNKKRSRISLNTKLTNEILQEMKGQSQDEIRDNIENGLTELVGVQENDPEWLQCTILPMAESFACYLEENCQFIPVETITIAFNFLRKLNMKVKDVPKPFIFPFDVVPPRIIIDWPDVAIGFFENTVCVTPLRKMPLIFNLTDAEKLIECLIPYLKRSW